MSSHVVVYGDGDDEGALELRVFGDEATVYVQSTSVVVARCRLEKDSLGVPGAWLLHAASTHWHGGGPRPSQRLVTDDGGVVREGNYSDAERLHVVVELP